MPLDRLPGDARTLEIAALFRRWEEEMRALDEAFATPPPEPFAPGVAPAPQHLSEAFKRDMRGRADALHPLARELAEVYLHRLDEERRAALRELLARHRRVAWIVQAVIDDYLERFLQSLGQGDLDVALALVAIDDQRFGGRDIERTLVDFRARLAARGVAPGPLFLGALPLAAAHDDPERGAHGLFVAYGPRWDEDDDAGDDDAD